MVNSLRLTTKCDIILRDYIPKFLKTTVGRGAEEEEDGVSNGEEMVNQKERFGNSCVCFDLFRDKGYRKDRREKKKRKISVNTWIDRFFLLSLPKLCKNHHP